jgi:hypothetical protein
VSASPGAERLLVGAPYDYAQGGESGAAHLFRFDGASGWTEVAKLVGSGIDGGDQFGCGLALGQDLALIAATREGAPGIVYAFAGTSGADCDGNGASDACDIFDGLLEDADADGIPDQCEGSGDVNGDGTVDVTDLLQVMLAWGPCPIPCPPGCLGDADGDCTAGIADLITVIIGWD